MIGKTIKAIHRGGRAKIAMPHLSPEADADMIAESAWLEVEDGKVFAVNDADYIIEFSDGRIASITSCGCCGGAELEYDESGELA